MQALTRTGFSLSHQPLSMLSLGDLGWIQITNSLLAGLFSLAFAVGVKRRLATGPATPVAVACLLLGIPFGPGFSWRLFLGVALGFAWITAYAVFLLKTTDPA